MSCDENPCLTKLRLCGDLRWPCLVRVSWPSDSSHAEYGWYRTTSEIIEKYRASYRLLFNRGWDGSKIFYGIGVTAGPGLWGLYWSEWYAKSFLTRIFKIPLISIIYKLIFWLIFAEDPNQNFHFLCLTVSGDHTQRFVVVMIILSWTSSTVTLDDEENIWQSGQNIWPRDPAGPMIDKNQNW